MSNSYRSAMKRDIMDVDILCVGAGVASLSAVLRLLRRLEREAPGKAPTIMVLEKGASVGAHVLSGAIIDPEPLGDLLSERELAAMPVESVVRSEAMYRLTRELALRLPWIPPAMRNRGMPLVSLERFTRYLGDLCEAAGAGIYPGMTAVELLQEGARVAGVRMGDRGFDRQGARKPNFQPGPHVHAKVVLLGEGACGVLAEHLFLQKKLGGTNPQTYAVGLKELVETPAAARRTGTVLHTFGYPQDSDSYGGGFVYHLTDTQVAVGLVTALDYRDAALNPHDLFRAFKAHPLIAPHLVGGKVIGYGAKIIPEGGYHAVPALVAEGVMILGDTAGLLDSLRLKGIHIAIQSGLAAGDALFEAWRKNDFSLAALEEYPRRFKQMSGWRQMQRVRNVRACFAHGTLAGLAGAGLSVCTGGRLPSGRMAMGQDHERLRPLSASRPGPELPSADQALQMDRLSDLYHSGTRHEEDQPPHIRIPAPERCAKECIPLYGAPCRLFCPAQVYALEDDGKTIRIDAANCLHCGTCSIKDPLLNIEWNLPEGEGGPRYSGM